VREHDPTLLGNTPDKLTNTVLTNTVLTKTARRQFP
jgi:hypothetical protein